MKLSQLLSIYPQLKWGEDPLQEVSSVCSDSRQLEDSCVFVAIRGHKIDGHKFLSDAIEKGAIALVVEDESQVPPGYMGAVVQVEDSRDALDQLSGRFHGYPAQKLFCVGVTGTNGKTSVTYMVEAIFKKFGWKTGVLGTIDHHLEGTQWESELTTPGPEVLQKRLAEMRALGAEAVVFEVSSHALSQSRADYIPFDTVVFTNLTRDHLDYHKDMEEYFATKERLFKDIPWRSKEKSVHAVINRDDSYGRKIQVASNAQTWTFGESKSDFQFQILKEDFSGTHFRVTTPRGDCEVHWKMIGRHNIYNGVAAVAVGLSAGVSVESCGEALSDFRGVPGRLQPVPNHKNLHVFVDYAHTDDALRSVLKSLQEVRQKSGANCRIITVFGCGGDRDRGKRPLMMDAAYASSDLVYLTSDNPRTEDPLGIIKDCLENLSSAQKEEKVRVEVDRRRAIEYSLKEAREDDVVLIAGKGHEDYQIVGTEKKPFSDVQVAREFLE